MRRRASKSTSMRRTALAAALTALAVVGPAAPALAHPAVPLDPTLPFDATYSATDNIEYLGRFPEHAGTAGGYPSEDGTVFYLTDPRGVYTYDTTDPARPTLLGSVALYQQTTGVALAQEDPDTNGEILLVDGATTPAATSSRLHVVDVSDPSDLRILSSLPVTDHTWTCVTGVDATGAENSCAYAYGRAGHIVDLTDPAAPELLEHTWRGSVGYGDRGNSPYTHDLTEIRPGLVMTAGASAVLMDTSDPTAPVYLTEIGERDRFSSLGYHSVEWAREGRDRYVVLGTEIAPAAVPGLPGAADNTAGSDCEGENSVIETWDASEVLKALRIYERNGRTAVFDKAQFRQVDSYDASGRGLFLTGDAPGSQLYCAHWMELHPTFSDGGLMAVAYYNRGTRFVEVGDDGTMSEVGWFTPAEGYAGSPQWVSDDVVYVMDYRRGLEVVRLTDAAATGVVSRAPDLIAPASAVRLPGLHVHATEIALGGAALLLVLVVGVERVARRRTGAAPA
jgi:hypothetical protein